MAATSRSVANRNSSLRLPEFFEIMPETVVQADLENIQPATDMDYLLKGDIVKLAEVRNRGLAYTNIPDGAVYGNYVVGPQAQIFEDTLTDQDVIARGGAVRLLERMRYPREIGLSGAVLFANFAGGSNYYHWMVETLPALRAVLEGSSRQYSAILLPRADGFHRETLDALGLGGVRLIAVQSLDVYRAESLVVPRFNSGWAPHQWTGTWLRSMILSSRGQLPDFPSRKRRLYISRNDAVGRRVVNEFDLRKFLIGLGFEVVLLSGLKVADQAKLFSEAEIVVGPHGAGMTNLLFCEPGTLVVEAFPDRWTSLCYMMLSQALGLRYCYTTDTSKWVPPINSGFVDSACQENQYSDLHVSIEKLRLLFSRLGVS
jgi:capsular polysaccharide biosynthesis protein